MEYKTKIETRCIHGEQHGYQDGAYAISFPIYQTASFSHLKPGHNETGYDYTRESNPTRHRLEETVSSLEGAVDTTAFTSGMAAISACFELFEPGDHILCSEDLYGGVVRFLQNIGRKNGLDVDFVDTTDLRQLDAAIRPQTKAIYVETPSNPMMKVTDLRQCAALAKANDAMLIVDNTFLTPYLQNPLELGADIVIHSGSKFLGGHNDTISGFLCSSTRELADRIRFISKTTGGTLAPMDAWLVMRGLKTLPIRIERQQQTAKELVQWMIRQQQIEKVYYVGLIEHPGYEINQSQARGAGCMISFSVDSKETALRILENVHIITFAESLGGTESLITYPLVQTHPDVPEETRERLGITDTLLRLSVGLENAEDLIWDLQQALGGTNLK